MEESNNEIWMPGHPQRRAPAVLSESDLIEFLRLDRARNPRRTIKYWRISGKLKSLIISRKCVYRLEDVMTFLKEMSENRTKSLEERAPPVAKASRRQRRIP